jgi:hypothetical protein
MTSVKSTNLEYTGVLMIAFGVIGLFQAASAVMTGTQLYLLPLFIVANALELSGGVVLVLGRTWFVACIGANILLLLARILAAQGRTLGLLEFGLWVFLVALIVTLLRESRKGESAEEEIKK